MTTSIRVAGRAGSRGSAAQALVLRLRLTGRASVTTLSALLVGVLLLAWLTVVAVSPLTLFAPLLLPVTAMVRSYCNRERRWIGRLTGRPVAEPYRRFAGGGPIRRSWSLLCDPASWRDAIWICWQAVVGWTSAALSVSLLLGSLFYLAYPLLFAVAPAPVFRDPFGPWSHLSSTAQSCALMPVALLCAALWYVTVLPLFRLEAAVGRALLGRNGDLLARSAFDRPNNQR